MRLIIKNENIKKSSTYQFLKSIVPECIGFKLANPYSILEDKYKFIFIHVPKTAGNAIIHSIFKQRTTGHYKVLNYKIYNKRKFGEYYKFGLTRNPWDRLVSAYFYLKNGGNNEDDYDFSKKYLYKYDSFEDFVLSFDERRVREKMFKWKHFQPQYKYLCDRNKNILVDYLGKYEDLESCYLHISKYFRSTLPLEVSNQSSHDNYREYYTPEMIQIVNEAYKEDIEIFSYSFE